MTGHSSAPPPLPPSVYRDENGTVHLPTHRKRRGPPIIHPSHIDGLPPSTSSGPSPASLPSSSPSAAVEWLHDRPPRRQPLYHLPSLIPSTPIPVPVVSAFLLTSALQVLQLLVLARGDSISTHSDLFLLTCIFQWAYLAYAYTSTLSPPLCLLLSPLSLLPPLFFPPTFPLYTYICAISTLTYLPHVLSLGLFPSHFTGWSTFMRAFFIVSYIDVRDSTPIATSTSPTQPTPSTSPNSPTPSPPTATWAQLRPLVLRDVQSAAWEEVSMLALVAAMWWLPPARSFGSVAMELSEGGVGWAGVREVAVLYLRYLLTLLFCTSALAFTDHFYSLIFLSLSLRAYPSQHSPLSSPSLSAFWGGRWNRTIHSLLYHALYLPIHSTAGRPAGWLAAFAGSAILHTYPAWVAGMRPHYIAMMGSFFLSHGLLMAVERALGLGKRRMTGRVWLWASLLATLPLICDPLYSLYGLF